MRVCLVTVVCTWVVFSHTFEKHSCAILDQYHTQNVELMLNCYCWHIPPSRVGVAVWTAHEEHARRRAYSDYLIQSHMRFLDVRLQVGAVQTTVDRSVGVTFQGRKLLQSPLYMPITLIKDTNRTRFPLFF